MKYTVNVDINASRDRVIERFSDTSSYKEWQPTLLICEHLEGTAGTVGSKTKLVHKMGRRQIEMIETIEELDMPDAQTMTYVAKGVWNQVVNRFEEVGDGQTRWTMESEFQCKGIMRVISRLMPGAFKKESLKHMRSFKEFAEN